MTKTTDIHHVTERSLRALAKSYNARVAFGDGVVTIRDEYGDDTSAHRDTDGRWIVADWSERNAQWTGYSPRGAERMQGYCGTFGRTLGALRRLGVRSFPTAHGALADAMK